MKMETIDLTPTWEEWFRVATVAIEGSDDPVKTFNTLKPDFENMASIATAAVEEHKAKAEEVILTDEQLSNLFITAIEGGSNYWYLLADDQYACLKTYLTGKNTVSECMLLAINDACEIKINDREEPDEVLGVVSTERVQLGLQKAIADGYQANVDNIKAGNYDAEDADILFQYIVLNEITFG